MATVVSIDDRLIPSLEIEDADGALHSYTLVPAPPGLDRRAVWITRTDTGMQYRVCQRQSGQMDCTCPDQTFRRRGAATCKHCRALLGLFLLLDQLR